jgi:HSP20 family protein
MAEAATKLPVKNENRTARTELQPFTSLRREIDRLFDDFGFGSLRMPRSPFEMEPFWRAAEPGFAKMPAVDIANTDKAYEITAELPGMDEKNVEVKLANGVLTIKGEKKEEKEEKQKDYHLSERRFGSFQRSFTLPEGIDSDKIDATFKDGVLTVTLPKTAESQKREKQIAIKKG